MGISRRNANKWKLASSTVLGICAALATLNLWNTSNLDLLLEAKYPFLDGQFSQSRSSEGMRWKGLPPRLPPEEITKKAYALILGAIIGDAAAAGVDGLNIYGEANRNGQSYALEFINPQIGPFCDGKAGDLSPAGEEAFSLLKAVAAAGRFDPEVYAKASFEDASQSDRRLSNVMIEFLKKYRQGYRYPFTGWDSFEANSISKGIVLTALYAGRPELEETVRQATAIHQSNKIAADAAVMGAKFLEGILLGYSPTEALDLCISYQQDSYVVNWASALKRFASMNWSCTEATYHLGKGCYMPATIQTALHCSLASRGYRNGIRDAIDAGGCVSTRAMFVGAVLAARDGVQSIPNPWKEKVTKYRDIVNLTQILVDFKAHLHGSM